MDPLLIDGESLTIENLYEVAFDRRRLVVHPAARQKMARSRAVVEGIVSERRPVYGISTGFGKLSDVHIGEDDISQLQHNLLRSHASGIGGSFSEEEVRALILFRGHVLSKSLSGGGPVISERLCDFFHHPFYPPISCPGTAGGDGALS